MTDPRPGCANCHDLWRGENRPVLLAVDAPHHESIYRCPVCGTYWLETERYRSPMTISDATRRLEELDAT